MESLFCQCSRNNEEVGLTSDSDSSHRSPAVDLGSKQLCERPLSCPQILASGIHPVLDGPLV